MKTKISFVIPCYKSEQTIGKVVGEIDEVYGNHEKYEYEVILINDCSPDNTFLAIKDICKANKNVMGIDLAKNFGQHSAILAGLRQVGGDVVVCLDDDGQTPPKEAIKLIEAVLVDGHDVAIARYGEKKHGFLRNLGSKANERMAKAMIGKPKNLFLSSYVAMKKFVAKEVCEYSFPFPYISGMLLRTTNDIVNVDVAHRAREVGVSGYTFRKLLSLWFNGFSNFSSKPLRLAIFIGMLMAIVGFALAVYAVAIKIIQPDVPLGWASTMAALTGIGGIILLVLGLMGEYIGRMFVGLNQQPQYVIREKLNDKEES